MLTATHGTLRLSPQSRAVALTKPWAWLRHWRLLGEELERPLPQTPQRHLAGAAFLGEKRLMGFILHKTQPAAPPNWPTHHQQPDGSSQSSRHTTGTRHEAGGRRRRGEGLEGLCFRSWRLESSQAASPTRPTLPSAARAEHAALGSLLLPGHGASPHRFTDAGGSAV